MFKKKGPIAKKKLYDLPDAIYVKPGKKRGETATWMSGRRRRIE
jgi:hypothetical protein